MAKIQVSLPDELLETVDTAAASESRSRSELVREAIRRYLADAPSAGRRRTAMEHLRASLAFGDWQAEDLMRAERDR